MKQFVEIRGLDLGQEMQDCLGAGDEEAPDEQMQLPEEDREDADKFNDAVESSQNSMSQESIKSPKGKNTKVANSRTEEDGYFRVTCKDNGTGMEHHDIPQMLGIGN